MSTNPRRAPRWLVLLFVGFLCLTSLAPATARADTNLNVGGKARIAYANGDRVRLRSGPSYGDSVVTMLPEGTVLDVEDGPITADDGSTWYKVATSDGDEGYIDAQFLQLYDPATDSTDAAGTAATASTSSDSSTASSATASSNDGSGNGTGASGDSVGAAATATDTGGNAAYTNVSAQDTTATVTASSDASATDSSANNGTDGNGGTNGNGAYSAGGSDATATANTLSAAAENAPGAVTGTGVISGTNGDGVRCRAAPSTDAAIITVLPEGTTVQLTGDASNNWQPVNCAGTGGYVYADYVSTSGSGANTTNTDNTASTDSGTGGASASGDSASGSSGDAATNPSAASAGDGTVTGTAVVTGTNGDGLRCRATPGYDGAIITVLPEGSTVSLRGDPVGDWQPVFCAGSAGYAYSSYLSSGSGGNSGSTSDTSSGGDPSANGTGGTSDSSGAVSGTGVVTGTNGDGLRCRADASTDAAIITVLPEGSSVPLLGAQQGDWQPVVCAGSDGWVYAAYITVNGDSGSGSGSGTGGDTSGSGSGDTGSGSGSTTGLQSGQTAVVTGTGGTGVRFRSGPSLDADTLAVLPDGTAVTVRDGSTGNWVAVTYNGTDGFIYGDYLMAGSGNPSAGSGDPSAGSGDPSAGSGDPNAGSGGSGSLAVGSNAMTTADLNLRYGPSYSAGVAAVAPQGTVVEITGDPQSGFYPVDWDGLNGYMYGDYLQATSQPLSQRGGSGDSSGSTPSSGNSGSGSGSGGSGSTDTGNAIANYALQYVGYPYVWGAAGPSAFDCSGFTEWVILHTLGIDITHDLVQQYDMGTPVAQNALQPGDLVFFQNTYQWGLSHVGIYIGNGQFVHAENETTGVVVSSLSSDYYASRWYGAVRYT